MTQQNKGTGQTTMIRELSIYLMYLRARLEKRAEQRFEYWEDTETKNW